MSGFFIVLGRMCLSITFILSGIFQVTNWQGVEAHLLNGLCDLLGHTENMPSLQSWVNNLIPWSGALLVGGLICQLLGGVLLFFGAKVRFAAFLLLLFLIPTTLIFHGFWYFEGPDHEIQRIIFLKNVSIGGGLLYILGMGKGSSSSKKIKQESEA